ncbi:hypothetical protein D3C83_73960 [compost metagenome]
MPANNSPTCAWMIEDRNTNPWSLPAMSRGSWITRGSTRGACTSANPELRPNASLPDNCTAKFRLLLRMRGNGCAGSSPMGVMTGMISFRK